MKDMKRLTLENYSKLKDLSRLAHYEEYNSNIITMLMWNHHYEIYYELFDHYAMILVKYPTFYAWLMPLCEKKYLKDAFESMKQYSFGHHFEFIVHGMTQEIKEYCESHNIPFIYEQDIDAQDYVYDIEMHKTLSGKKMQKRRNHFNAFIKEYEHRYFYRALSKEDKKIVLDFLDEWIQTSEYKDSIEIEKIGISYLFDIFEEVDLKGGCIFVDDELKGFNLYSELSEKMLQMHVEKVDKSIRGLSCSLLKFTLQDCGNYTLLNREDDMGLAHLRKAKKDMIPVYKIKKYTAIYGHSEIVKASEKDLEMIKELWINNFDDEDEYSMNFYFDHLYDPFNTYLLKYDHTILSMLQIRYMNIMKDNQIRRIGLIFGVATHSKYQGCGYMKQLLNDVLNQYPNETFLIQAYNWDVYQSFGFKEAYTYKQSVFESKGSYDGNLCTDSSHLLSIYNDYVKNKDGYRIRNIHYYDEFFIPYYEPYYEIYANEDAYVVVDKEHTYVFECIYRDMNALISLLNRFDKIVLNGDIAFNEYKKCHMLMARGSFELNDSLFIHESM